MEAEGAVNQHLRHLKVRNLRDASISNRRYVLRRLAAWANGPILYLTESQLELWQGKRAETIKAATLRMEMTSVREFYKWCIREGLRKDNPADRLDMPRVARGLPRPVPDASLAGAMAEADPRICAILALAAFAGLRACEIARLDWAEVHLADEGATLRVVDGKGGRGRVLPVSTALAVVLRQLPARHGPVITQPNGHAGHCKPHRISQMANTFLHEAGVRETLHQCRHRFATATYAACQDIRAVQELMGHSSPTTTSIYAAVPRGVSSAAVEAAGTLGTAA